MPRIFVVVALIALPAYSALMTDVVCGAGRLDEGLEVRVDHAKGSSSASCDASANWSAWGQVLTDGVVLEAEADYGSVRLYGQQYWRDAGADDGTIPDLQFGKRTVQLRGIASFDDSLTILSAPRNAVLVAVVYGGTLNFDHQSDARIQIGSIGMSWDHTEWALSEVVEVPFSLGAPVPITGLVEAFATNHSGYGATTDVVLDLTFALVAGWDGNMLDGNEQHVTDFIFHTRSGARYNLNGTMTPEPRSIWLLGTGLATFLGISWKSFRRR